MIIVFSHRQYLMCIRDFAQSTLRRLPFNHTYMHTLEVIKTSRSQRVGMSSMFLASYDRDTQICPWYIQNISHWSKHTTDLQYLLFPNYPSTLWGVVKEYLNDFWRLGALLLVGGMCFICFLLFQPIEQTYQWVYHIGVSCIVLSSPFQYCLIKWCFNDDNDDDNSYLAVYDWFYLNHLEPENLQFVSYQLIGWVGATSWAFVNGPPVHHGVLTRILESKHDLGESTPFTGWLRFSFLWCKMFNSYP